MSSFPHPSTPPRASSPPSPPPSKKNCNLVQLKTLTKKSYVKQHITHIPNLIYFQCYLVFPLRAVNAKLDNSYHRPELCWLVPGPRTESSR